MTDFLTADDFGVDTGNPGLHPSLIDPSLMPSEYRQDLAGFLHDLLEVRGFPQHLACIFNALRFGYDLHSRGYHLALLSEELFVPIWTEVECDAPPVGAFTHLLTRKNIGQIPTEVVYKEGRHPDARSDAVADDVADTTVRTDGTHLFVREALVLDRPFLGLDDPDHVEHTIARMRADAVELTPRGHFVGDLRYRSFDDANADDADFYTRWLARQADGTRLPGLLADLLDTDEPGTARTALQQIFRTLRTVIADDRDLDLWRGYMIDKRRYDRRTDNVARDAVLGSADLKWLWRSISAPPRNISGPGAPDLVQLHALGPRLLDHQRVSHTTPTKDVDASLARHIDGTLWVQTITDAQMFCTLEADVDRTDDLYVASTWHNDGVAVHTRLDDIWQQGGVWRTERCDPTRPPVSLLRNPPDVPLGLGTHPWDEPLPGEEPTTDEPADDAEGAPAQDDAAEEEVLEATFHTWTIALATSRLDAGTVHVPAAICDRWGDGQPFTVRLEHLDDRTLHSASFDRRRQVLTQIDWPPSVPIAAIVDAQVAAVGGTVVTVATRRLAEPVTYDIDGTAFRVAVEVDEALLRRTLAEDPGAARRRHTRARPSTRAGLAAVIIAAIAEHGSPTDDGRREMLLADLTATLFPHSGATPRNQELVLEAARRAGLPTQPGVVQWDPRTGAGVGSDVNLDVLRQAGDQRADAALRSVRAHHVGVHLRRLTVSRRATPERRRQYRSERAEYGWTHMPEELPDGFTYVTDHDRGR